MFFFPILSPVLAIHILAAVLPAMVLLCYIYRKDTVEKEPAGLLLRLLLMGVLAALCASVLEGVGEFLLDVFVSPQSPAYIALLAFLVVALVEEGTKLWLLRRATWHHPAFNFRFDGVVYAVFVSLGFAAFENIQYVFHYGLSVALPRALLAVPGHMAFAVYMGLFYGRAKCCDSQGDEAGAGRNLWMGYFWAVFLHGFYDTCAMTGTSLATGIFLLFVLVMFSRAFRLVKRESAADTPV